jgi:hypothetical protein
MQMKATQPLPIDSIDVDNDSELDARMAKARAEGDKIYRHNTRKPSATASSISRTCLLYIGNGILGDLPHLLTHLQAESV